MNTFKIYETQSLCPECLKPINAFYEGDETCDQVFLNKNCPDHGDFRVKVWEGLADFLAWKRPKKKSSRLKTEKEINLGCPFDCGLCPDHNQHTCTALIEVTSKCSLGCPICYAASGSDSQETDPSLSELERIMAAILRQSGACNLQLSGGEPTERDDLDAIISLARKIGFKFVQLNTNGLRLAGEPGYAKKLADSGLASLYLQFDAVSDPSLKTLRGRYLLKEKNQAIEASLAAGLGVVLVATLVPGINTDKIGDLLQHALSFGEGVRGLHFQPVASFGRHPWELKQAQSFTLPEIRRALAEQTHGMLKADHFHPPSCEHALCSFSALYKREKGGRLSLIPEAGKCCDSAPPGKEPIIAAEEGSRLAKNFTALHWKQPANLLPSGKQLDDFDKFLASTSLKNRFTISAMAFQDALTIDLERLKGCCIHVANAKGELIPFCAYNLTSFNKKSLYRGHGE